MEFMFDSANLADLEEYLAIYPVAGVTSNPSILKAEGKVSFFGQMRGIRKLIGPERSLHIQVLAENAEGTIAEAHRILEEIDRSVYIKIPVTEEGLKAIRALKSEGIGVTATAIYSRIQGFMAIAAGADFIAPYCNRMANMDIDFRAVIAAFRQMIDENGAYTKILAASFHCMEQVNDALQAGAHIASVPPALLHSAMSAPAIGQAVRDFHADWVAIHGECGICDLSE